MVECEKIRKFQKKFQLTVNFLDKLSIYFKIFLVDFFKSYVCVPTIIFSDEFI